MRCQGRPSYRRGMQRNDSTHTEASVTVSVRASEAGNMPTLTPHERLISIGMQPQVRFQEAATDREAVLRALGCSSGS